MSAHRLTSSAALSRQYQPIPLDWVRQVCSCLGKIFILKERAAEVSMSADEKMTPLGPPVPELPVADVERAQQHYRDALGFEIGWLYPDSSIGAVLRGKVTIFFRKRTPPFEPAIHWVFAKDIDAT